MIMTLIRNLRLKPQFMLKCVHKYFFFLEVLPILFINLSRVKMRTKIEKHSGNHFLKVNHEFVLIDLSCEEKKIQGNGIFAREFFIFKLEQK